MPLPCADSPLCGSASRKERGEGERGRLARAPLEERERADEIWSAPPGGDTCTVHEVHSMKWAPFPVLIKTFYQTMTKLLCELIDFFFFNIF